MRRLAQILTVAAVLGGCSYSIQKSPPPAMLPFESYSIRDLSFNSVYMQVLRTRCVKCHGNEGNVNLENYKETKKHLQKITKVSIKKAQMPPRPEPPLNPYEVGLLNHWIEIGAPEGAPIPPLEPTYESIKLHILEPKCIICHTTDILKNDKAIDWIPMDTKEDLFKEPLPIVIPGNAKKSQLIKSVTSKDELKLMPPEIDEDDKPTGYSRLSQEEINVLIEWINRGAVD